MNFRSIRPSHAKTLAGIALVCALAACSTSHDANAPTAENLAAPLDDYLAQRGDICLAMVDWPIDLTEAEAGAGARHAIQFPVMEQLGLVHSTIVAVPKSSENPDGAVKRFELTDAGRKFYKPHASAARGAEQQQPANDFCVAHLKREQIVDVKVDASNAQHPMAVVSYTYQVETALVDAGRRTRSACSRWSRASPTARAESCSCARASRAATRAGSRRRGRFDSRVQAIRRSP
jgi:hypothetical protein